MKKPTLSIVIPTYNRSELLDILLESIARDFSTWPDDLEVIVINNASTDDTRGTVERRIARGFPARLICNPENIGMDANLAACFDAATGKYLWQIGDDEVLYRGTAQYVLNHCRNNDFGLLHIDSLGFPRGEQDSQLSRAIPAAVSIKQLDSKSIFQRANVFLTFISANVINRDAVIAEIPDFNPKAETSTYLPQMAWIFGALKAVNCHYHVHTPLLGALLGNTSGYRLIEVFGQNLPNITERQLGTTITGARKTMINAVLTRLMPGELMAHFGNLRTHSHFQQEDLRTAMQKAFGGNLYFNLLVRPLFSSNRLQRQAVFFATRLFNRLNRALGYALL